VTWKIINKLREAKRPLPVPGCYPAAHLECLSKAKKTPNLDAYSPVRDLNRVRPG
jgi:hypothetical protein